MIRPLHIVLGLALLLPSVAHAQGRFALEQTLDGARVLDTHTGWAFAIQGDQALAFCTPTGAFAARPVLDTDEPHPAQPRSLVPSPDDPRCLFDPNTGRVFALVAPDALRIDDPVAGRRSRRTLDGTWREAFTRAGLRALHPARRGRSPRERQPRTHPPVPLERTLPPHPDDRFSVRRSERGPHHLLLDVFDRGTGRSYLLGAVQQQHTLELHVGCQDLIGGQILLRAPEPQLLTAASSTTWPTLPPADAPRYRSLGPAGWGSFDSLEGRIHWILDPGLLCTTDLARGTTTSTPIQAPLAAEPVLQRLRERVHWDLLEIVREVQRLATERLGRPLTEAELKTPLADLTPEVRSLASIVTEHLVAFEPDADGWRGDGYRLVLRAEADSWRALALPLGFGRAVATDADHPPRVLSGPLDPEALPDFDAGLPRGDWSPRLRAQRDEADRAAPWSLSEDEGDLVLLDRRRGVQLRIEAEATRWMRSDPVRGVLRSQAVEPQLLDGPAAEATWPAPVLEAPNRYHALSPVHVLDASSEALYLETASGHTRRLGLTEGEVQDRPLRYDPGAWEVVRKRLEAEARVLLRVTQSGQEHLHLRTGRYGDLETLIDEGLANGSPNQHYELLVGVGRRPYTWMAIARPRRPGLRYYAINQDREPVASLSPEGFELNLMCELPKDAEPTSLWGD